MAKRDRPGRRSRNDLATPGDGGAGALESLLDTERRLIERLAAAAVEAQELLASAKVAADERARLAEQALLAEIAALRDREETAREAAVAAIRASAQADVTRFDAVTETELEALADALIERLLGETAAGTPRSEGR
jgi:hypothetical protein